MKKLPAPLGLLLRVAFLVLGAVYIVPSVVTLEHIMSKRNKTAFRLCIVSNFPIGSDYTKLEEVLVNDGFGKAKDLGLGALYSRWDSPISEYAAVVYGRVDEQGHLVEIGAN